MKIFRFSLFCFLLTALSSCDDSSTSATEVNEPSSSSKIKESSSSIKASSSSSVKISSSVQQNTSSSSSTKSDIQQTNYNPDTGLLTDERDGKVYKTVKIGNQIWMAENLNFDIKDYPNTIINRNIYGNDTRYEKEAICPKKSTEDDCEKYGRLYTQKGFLLSLNDKRVFGHFPAVPDSIQPYQGVCPRGWHVPNFDEWQTLFSNVYVNELVATEDGGNNKSGFNSKVIGFAFNETEDNIYDKTYGYDSTLTVYASITEATANDIEGIWLEANFAKVQQASKELFFAVRCLKD